MSVDAAARVEAGEESTERALVRIFEEVLGKPVPSTELRLAEDLALDSVQLLELIARIDDRTGVDLGARLAEGVRLFTVAEVIGEVEARLAQDPQTPLARADQETRAPDSMHAAFFEHDGARLYGVLHPPRSAAPRARGENASDLGVVICNPFAHEYFQCARALRHLGLSLARAGHPVLRFDFEGTGDSSGTLWDARLERWVASVGAAARELRARSGVTRVALVGLRLGATIAALAAADTPHDDLVLWNPIADGRRYARELEALHLQAMGKRSLRTREPGELLGTRVHPDLLEAIASVDWSVDRPSLPVPPLLLRGAEDRTLLACLEGVRGLEDVLDVETWSWQAFYSSFYWPQSALKRIVQRVSALDEGAR